MQKASFEFASHEAILKVIVDDVTSGRLYRNQANMYFLVVPPAFRVRFSDAEQIASLLACTIARIESLDIVDICPFGVEVREFPNEGSISVVTDGFQSCRLELTNDA